LVDVGAEEKEGTGEGWARFPLSFVVEIPPQQSRLVPLNETLTMWEKEPKSSRRISGKREEKIFQSKQKKTLVGLTHGKCRESLGD